MDGMPDALDTLVLVERHAMSRSDAESRFIAAEARIAIDAIRKGRDATQHDEILIGWFCVPSASAPTAHGATRARPSSALHDVSGPPRPPNLTPKPARLGGQPRTRREPMELETSTS